MDSECASGCTGQRHGQQPVSGTADPRSSPTGQVIRGLRWHNQNTFGPTEGQNEQWREANRRRQRIRYRGLVPTPPPPLPILPCRAIPSAFHIPAPASHTNTPPPPSPVSHHQRPTCPHSPVLQPAAVPGDHAATALLLAVVGFGAGCLARLRHRPRRTAVLDPLNISGHAGPRTVAMAAVSGAPPLSPKTDPAPRSHPLCPGVGPSVCHGSPITSANTRITRH